MKTIFQILLLCTFTYNLFSNDCNDDNRILYVPKTDSNPFGCDIKHLWVGIPNLILTTKGDIIEISANNSELTKINDYTGKLSDAIIPFVNDTIVIQAKYLNYKNDTVDTYTKFFAIYPPNIEIVLREEYLYLDSNKCIHTEVNINNYNKPDYERFQYGSFEPYPQIFKNGVKLTKYWDFLDEISEMYNTDIDSINKENTIVIEYDMNELLERGNAIFIPRHYFIDNLTGLSYFTNEYYYLIK